MNEAFPYGTFAPRGFVRRAIDATRALPDGWLARRLVILIRRLAAYQLRGAPVDIDALGIRMRLLPAHNVCEKRMLFAPRTFDARELEILAGRIHDGYVFLDIGANVGVYALFVAARAGATARVLAVEPQPDIFERLVYNIRLNAVPTVKALRCAVAEKSGDVTLFLDPKNSGESSVKIVNSGGATPIRVPARTLLDIVTEEGFGHIDAIKLDVEGAEDLILETFLASAPEPLLPELLILENGSDRWQVDLDAALSRKGYRVLARTRLNRVYERARTPGARHG